MIDTTDRGWLQAALREARRIAIPRGKFGENAVTYWIPLTESEMHRLREMTMIDESPATTPPSDGMTAGPSGTPAFDPADLASFDADQSRGYWDGMGRGVPEPTP